jgi:polyphosphate kinase
VHSKIGIIRKKFGEEILTYAILSTGNFNEITARFYTDHVLMTTDHAIVGELTSLFKYLQRSTKNEDKPKLKFSHLLVSQFNMIERFEALIEQQIRKAQLGEEALIQVKVNNLEDPGMINLLYKASNAGVKINLIVRGICCLMPGIAGMSENITVKRLVDRYLEHTRIFIFGTGENPEVIMGSADWMIRNLHRRIEVSVAMKKMDCKKELLDYFRIQWTDTDKAVVLTPELEQHFIESEGEKVNAQYSIYKYLQDKK